MASDGDVRVYSLSGGSLSRPTFDGSAYPSWAPSGDRIAYMRGNQAVLARSADGTGAEEQLVAPGSDALVPGSWSADGRTLALTRGAVGSGHPLPHAGGQASAVPARGGCAGLLPGRSRPRRRTCASRRRAAAHAAGWSTGPAADDHAIR